MKKLRFFPIFLLVLGIGLVFTTCKEEKATVNKIKLDQSFLVLRPDGTAQLTAAIEPASSKASVTWASENSQVATVSSNGLVTAVSEGETTIIATAGDKTAKCMVEVTNLKNIYVSPKNITLVLKNAETKQLSFSTDPSDFKESTSVSWSSEDEKIATVSGNGLVTPVAVGKTTIKVKAEGKTATCEVEVIAEMNLVTGVKLSKTATTLMVTEKDTIEATVLPDNATDKTVTWTNSNPEVATFNNGVIEAIKAGETTITVTTTDGNKTATCTVTVVPLAPKEIVITPASGYIADINGTLQLKAEVLPEELADSLKQVVWTSLDETILTINDKGKVTGKAEGIAKVRATHATIPTLYQDCEITVALQEVESVTVTPDKLVGYIDDQATLTATVLPEKAGNKNVTWSSSNTTVATVDKDGKVTAKALGTATITATSNNGKTGKCEVSIIPQPVTSITISPASASVNVNETMQLSANVQPSKAANKAVTWSSNDESKATVDQNGLVLGKAKGSAIITATAKDGSGVKGTCNITVTIEPITSIKIFAPEKTLLNIGDAYTPREPFIQPETATYKTLEWTSSNPSAVEVTDKNKGTIKVRTEATDVTITAKATDGSGVTASYVVNALPNKIYTTFGDNTIYSGNALKMYEIGNAAKLLAIKSTRKLYSVSGDDFYKDATVYFTAPESVTYAFSDGNSFFWVGTSSSTVNCYKNSTKKSEIQKKSGYTYRAFFSNENLYVFEYMNPYASTTEYTVYKNGTEMFTYEMPRIEDVTVVDDVVYSWENDDTNGNKFKVYSYDSNGKHSISNVPNIKSASGVQIKKYDGVLYYFCNKGAYAGSTNIGSSFYHYQDIIYMIGTNSFVCLNYNGGIYYNEREIASSSVKQMVVSE